MKKKTYQKPIAEEIRLMLEGNACLDISGDDGDDSQKSRDLGLDDEDMWE